MIFALALAFLWLCGYAVGFYMGRLDGRMDIIDRRVRGLTHIDGQVDG